MNVILLSPGFPDEMPRFARGLVSVGARVLGVGEQPERALPDLARRNLVAYLQVEEDNHGARRLYTRLGFAEAYSYAYWVSSEKSPHRLPKAP